MSTAHIEIKPVWTEKAFDYMSWHDAPIHGMLVRTDECRKLLFDLDFSFWSAPGKTADHFWVSPCTWVFPSVSDLSMHTPRWNTGDRFGYIATILDVQILSKHSVKRSQVYRWLIELDAGWMTFSSFGFRLYLRKPPVEMCGTQTIEKGRGKICFDEKTTAKPCFLPEDRARWPVHRSCLIEK